MYRYISSILLIFLLCGCDDVFEFSPYQANVDEAYEDQNAKSIGKLYLKSTAAAVDSFSFITIADSHNDFDDLKDAVDKINSLEDIDFVVHLGDVANTGLLKEYKIYSEIIEPVRVPIITCIGNHDYLSNGGEIYQQMFGDFNFTLDYKGIRFVFFDATRFESRKRPDMDWLGEQLNGDLPNIIISHVPPFDDQYKDEDVTRYKYLVETNHVIASIHGHHHSYYYGSPLGTELQFLIPGSVGNKNMCRITVYANGTYNYSMIHF